MNDRLKQLDRGLLLWRLATFTALDGVAIAAIYYLSKDEWQEFEWLAIPAGIAILWAVQAALALRHLLWMLISTLMVEPKFLEANFLEIMRASKLPGPSQGGYSASFQGLAELSEDAGETARNRVTATAIYTAWSAVMRFRGMAQGLVLESAFNRAVAAYDAERRGPYLRRDEVEDARFEEAYD